MPGKISQDNQDDILKQFISDDEDEAQLGNAEENNEDEDEDQSATGSVEDDDDDQPVDKRKQDEEDDKELKQKLEEDKEGNLLHKGKVVAKAGKDRGIFDKLKRRLGEREQQMDAMAKQLAQISQGARELMGKYKALQEERDYGKTIGLDPAETKEALELYAKSKIDPKGALRAILTKAHLAGNDLSDLGVAGPLDPQVVAQHVLALQEKNKPAPTDPVEPPHVVESRMFLDRYPELKDPQNSGLLQSVADAKNKFPHLSLDECWIRIKNYLENKAKETARKPKPEIKNIPHNSSNERRTPNKKGLDVAARATSKSFNDIGRELLADLKALEEN